MRKRNASGQNIDQSRAIAHHLVRNYPDHSFVISRDEARNFGLPIENAESYFRWDYVEAFHDNFRENRRSRITMISDVELTQHETVSDNTQEDTNEESTETNE